MNHEDNYDEYDVYTDVRSEICNIVSNIPLIYMYLICTTVWKIWNVTRSRASDIQKYIYKQAQEALEMRSDFTKLQIHAFK